MAKVVTSTAKPASAGSISTSTAIAARPWRGQRREALQDGNSVHAERLRWRAARCGSREAGWLKDQGVLAVSLDDKRLSWPEKELVRQLGDRLYGHRPGQPETTEA